MPDEKQPILRAAAASTLVGDGRKPSVEIVAYTGGFIAVPGWGDVAFDLDGIDYSMPVALLADHDARVAGIVGQGTARVEANRLVVSGPLSKATDAARQVIDLGREGFAFQASVGIEPVDIERLVPGSEITLNGRNLAAPDRGGSIVRSGRLREVSITALGCDSDSSVSIAASRRRLSMANTETDQTLGQEDLAGAPTQPTGTNAVSLRGVDDLRKSRADEIDRQQKIAATCAEFGHPTRVVNSQTESIEAAAVREGWTPAETGLEALRAARPQTAPIVSGSHRTDPTGAEAIQAALLVRAGLTAVAEKTLGERVLEQSRRLHSASMLDLCRAALVADQVTPPSSRNDLIRASLSTGSMPVALGAAVNKSVQAAYSEGRATWRSFAATRSAANFHDHHSIRPSFVGDLEEVAKGGDLKHGTFGEAVFKWRVDTFGKVLKYDRRDIVNDDLNILAETGPAFGRMALRKVSDLAYTALLEAGSHFAEANGNLLAGGGVDASLTVDALAAAITLMRTQRDDENVDLDIQPMTLLVPPELESRGKQALESEFIERAVNQATGNPTRRAVRLEVESRLSNTQRFSTASPEQWYLVAGPLDLPMVVGFLDGMQAPTVEFFDLSHDVNSLSVAWRVHHDFGAAMGDHRAAVRADGVPAA